MTSSIRHRSASIAFLVAFGHAAIGQTLGPLGPLDGTGVVTFYIHEGDAPSAYRTGDRELAEWALQAWERATRGSLRFVPGVAATALLQIHFVTPGSGLYGEMRPTMVAGRRGAAVYIRPDTDALGPDIAALARSDELFRDTVVYLTCVHEIGHALGLAHTAAFEDIMFYFGFGGDLPAFFGRFRAQLRSRSDVAATAALSSSDVARVRALYPLE